MRGCDLSTLGTTAYSCTNHREETQSSAKHSWIESCIMVIPMPFGSAALHQYAVFRAYSWLSHLRWAYLRDLLRELVVRDIKLRYKGSILGQAWTMLNPMAELLVLLFVFQAVLSIGIPNYAPFLFTGILVYGWFQTSLYYATGAIVNNRS